MDTWFVRSKLLFQMLPSAHEKNRLFSLGLGCIAQACFREESTDNSPEKTAIAANDRTYGAAYAKALAW